MALRMNRLIVSLYQFKFYRDDNVKLLTGPCLCLRCPCHGLCGMSFSLLHSLSGNMIVYLRLLTFLRTLTLLCLMLCVVSLHRGSDAVTNLLL